MEAFFSSKWADCPSGVIRAIRNPWTLEIIDEFLINDEDYFIAIQRKLFDLAKQSIVSNHPLRAG